MLWESRDDSRHRLSSNFLPKCASTYPVFAGGASLSNMSPRSPLSLESSLEEDPKFFSEHRQTDASAVSCTATSSSSLDKRPGIGITPEISGDTSFNQGDLWVRTPQVIGATSEEVAYAGPCHLKTRQKAISTGCRPSKLSSGCFTMASKNASLNSALAHCNLSQSSTDTKPGISFLPFRCLSARHFTEKLAIKFRKDKCKLQEAKMKRSYSGELCFTDGMEPRHSHDCHDQASDVSRDLFSPHINRKFWPVDLAVSSRRLPSFVSPKFDIGHSSRFEAKVPAKEEVMTKLNVDSSLWDNSMCISFFGEGSTQPSINLLLQGIITLCKEKRDVALQVATTIRLQFLELQDTCDALRLMQKEMEGRIIAAEKCELNTQQHFEHELERREADWFTKLEKIKREENRLKERVVEMAKEKVTFQKLIASHKAEDASLKTQLRDYESSLCALTQKSRQIEKEHEELKRVFHDIWNNMKAKDVELKGLRGQNHVLEFENAGLQREVVRLHNAFKDQARTMKGLWQELCESVSEASDDSNQGQKKLQKELLRLAAVEVALRSEINALHHELQVRLHDHLHIIEAGLDADVRNHSINELLVKLYFANHRVEDLEHQLAERDEDLKHLQAQTQNQMSELSELQSELQCLTHQRDEFCKEADSMSKEAIRLTVELADLRRAAEKLDEELMLKEGQLSILQQICHEADQ